MIISFTQNVHANGTLGWIKDSTGWWYRLGGGKYYQDTWKNIDGSDYYFEKTGYIARGLKHINGVWYYFDESGRNIKSRWVQYRDTYIYLGEKGELYYDRYTPDGYYVDKRGRWEKGSWKKDDYGWWYKLENGLYLKNTWRKINNTWYYFLPSGYIKLGWINLSGTTYYFDQSGSMKTDWVNIENKWYYFYSNGEMAKDKWIGSYYLGSDGAMLTNTKTPDGYYVDENGRYLEKFVPNWIKDNEGARYQYEKNNYYKNTFKEIDGFTYYFGDKGYIKINSWQLINGNYYYFDQDGHLLKNTKTPDGYYVDKDGVWIEKKEENKNQGWIKDEQGYKYIKDNKPFNSGWLQVGDYWFFFKNEIMQTGWLRYNNGWYYLDSNGRMQTGWVEIDSLYYFNNNGLMLKGIQSIDGKKHLFRSSGAWLKQLDSFKNYNPLKGKGTGKFEVIDTKNGERPTFIVDLSNHNSKAGPIDYNKLKESVDAVILRIGFGNFEMDLRFLEYIKNVKEKNIPFGVYFYSYALNVETAVEEAEETIKALRDNGIDPDYPVYFDIEDADSYKSRRNFAFNRYTAPIYSDMVTAFCEIIADAGYEPGVYASKSWFNLFDRDFSNYHIWLAHWGVSKPTMDFTGLWQYTSDGVGQAIGLSSKYVDENYGYFRPKKKK